MRRSERSRSPRTLAVALAVGVLAAACGGDNGDNGDGVTEVDVWIGFTDYRLDWTQERADEFSAAHADYQVNVQGYDSYEALFQATTLAAQQGDPPAVVQYFEVATQEARDAVAPSGDPLFASVESALAGRTEVLGEPVVLDDVVAAARDYYTTDGEFSSMPWNTSSTLLYANGDLLDAAGVAEVPATWAEIEAACESLADLDEPPHSLHHLAQPRLVLRTVDRPAGRAARRQRQRPGRPGGAGAAGLAGDALLGRVVG